MSDTVRERLPDGRLRLRWAEPSPWLRAGVPMRRRDGELVDPVDRRGRVKAAAVHLTAPVPAVREVHIRRRDGHLVDPQFGWAHTLVASVALVRTDPTDPDVVNLTGVDWRFVLGADRRAWTVVEGRFDDDAHRVALALAEAGVVELVVPITPAGADMPHPIRWHLTAPWVDIAREMSTHRTETTTTLRARAADLADRIHARDAGFADALRTTPAHSPTLPILVAAAEDLLTGTTHDGPRAFSQAHFGHTKAREDAPERLRTAGVAEDTLDALGLRRSPYVGLGGPVTAAGWDATGWAGPVLFRAEPHRDLDPHLSGTSRALLLVENLQAAETVCDQHSDIAVVWFAGQPAASVVDVCATLATQAAASNLRVLIAPDADLGGVRIAARLLERLPAVADVRVIDTGEAAHEIRSRFSDATLTAVQDMTNAEIGAHTHLLHVFAKAVAARGYPVEQEATIRAAITSAIALPTAPHG